jgi:Cu2+-exporting ATPase
MTDQCKHCGEKVAQSHKFCCFGCELANKLINELNLEKYYEFCKNIYQSKPMKVYQIDNKLDYIAHVQKEGSLKRINLIVEGIHCGSCVWLIENTLKKQPNVLNARVNMSTKRLVLEWEGKAEKIIEAVSTIEKIGYKLIPFTPDASLLTAQKYEYHLLRCMFISGAAWMGIMMITLGIWASDANEMGVYLRSILHWIVAIIAVPAVIFSAEPFFKSALKALRAGHTNMDVPISIATITATLISIYETTIADQFTYFDAATNLVFFLLIGRYLDFKMRNKARQYAQNLILTQAKSVTIASGKTLRLVDIKKVRPGDIAFIAVGERIPIDGQIIEGVTQVDNSLITGETMPIDLKVGEFVNAGTINLTNPIKVKVLKVAENTVLGEIIKLMETAEQAKAKYVQLADKIASFYTPIVLTISLVTFAYWAYFGNLTQGLINAISVLIITCPCALGLAVPVVQVIASSKLMAQGILLKTGNALEKLSGIDTVVFDKTGTLTIGKPQLLNQNDFTKKELEVISAMAAKSKHPLSQAIVATVGQSDISLKVTEEEGMGLKAKYKGAEIRLGNRKWCEVKNQVRDQYTEVWFKSGNNKEKRLIFLDKLKEDATKVVAWAKSKKFACWILSGDKALIVSKIARECGIENYKSEVTPKDKYKFIDELTRQGKKVLMVGDGLNDSAALKAAYVSMSPSSGLDITQNAADIVFHSKLKPVVTSYDTAVFAQTLVKQNFFLSFAYNAVTIPIAMAGFVTPVLAAIVMSLSSIMVVVNSMRLSLGKNK